MVAVSSWDADKRVAKGEIRGIRAKSDATGRAGDCGKRDAEVAAAPGRCLLVPFEDIIPVSSDLMYQWKPKIHTLKVVCLFLAAPGSMQDLSSPSKD